MTESRPEKTRRWAESFEAGDFAGAEEIARQLVAENAGDGEALCLLAQTLFREKKTKQAVDFMRSALELDPMSAPFNNDYGVMLAALGRWEEAASAHGIAATLDPSNVDARFNLALALWRSGEKERARAELDRVLAVRPDLPDALALDGEMWNEAGDPARAAESFRKAIDSGLEKPEFYVKLARALRRANREDEALEALRVAERVSDDDAVACFQLGTLYHEQGDGARAERFLRRTLALDPAFTEAYNLLGIVLQDKGEAAVAMTCFAYTLANNPKFIPAYINLGSASVRDGRLSDAVFVLERATRIDPGSSAAWNNLGDVLSNLLRVEEAEAAFRRALEIQPDFAEADYNLGLLLLKRGEFAEGWRRYESRWRAVDKENTKRPRFSQPEWDGRALGTRSLLVYREQGLGDCLQFVRYLPLLRERHPEAAILFLNYTPLDRLFIAQGWNVRIVPGKAVHDLRTDVQIPLSSLPHLMGTTLSTLPARVPYITAPEEFVQKWGERLGPLPGRKVGLVWGGSDRHEDQKLRSLRLGALAPLLEVGGISWVSLQKERPAGEGADEGWAERIFDPMEEAEDFADTAGLIASLDLVVSVDTSVAHLAGAMGKPVWLLNRFSTDWRWMLDREDSPWYPTMRIFRQPALGDWESVVKNAAQALAEWVRQGGGDPARTLALPESLAAGKVDASARLFAEHVFGDPRLSYKIARARHGWMLSNPNDVYIGDALLEYGEYNEIEAQVLHLLLFKPGRVVEVGGNMGSHTVGLAKAAAARGEEMVVFEPQPVVFQNLCANLALNGLRNVRAWPFACGDETGTVTFAEPDYGARNNFGAVQMGFEEGAGRVTVPCVRLDDFLGEEAVALIKVDVEGFELAALRGAEETLRRSRPILYVENDRPDKSKELIEWLWSRGYRLFWHTPPLFNPDNFSGKSVNLYGGTVSLNMVCMPKELVEGTVSGFEEIVDSSRHPFRVPGG